MDLEKMLFLRQRFEEVIERSIADRESLYTKANFVFALLAGIAAFLCGKMLEGQGIKGTLPWAFYITETVILVVLSAALACLCMMPSGYRGLGGEPNQMLQQSYWKQPLIGMEFGYAILLQDRMDLNFSENQKVAFTIKTVAVLAAFSPLASIVIAFSVWLFVC